MICILYANICNIRNMVYVFYMQTSVTQYVFCTLYEKHTEYVTQVSYANICYILHILCFYADIICSILYVCYMQTYAACYMCFITYITYASYYIHYIICNISDVLYMLTNVTYFVCFCTIQEKLWDYPHFSHTSCSTQFRFFLS